MLTQHDKRLLQAEEAWQYTIDQLSVNLYNLRQCKGRLTRTASEVRACTKPFLKRLLEARLRGRCGMYVSLLLHRKKLLWQFSRRDEQLRRLRSTPDHSDKRT